MLELNHIYQGDCLDLMQEMPDKCVDLIITSPPYNMGNKSLGYQPNSTVEQKHYDKYDDNKKEIEYILMLNNVITEGLRISRYVFWNVQFVRTTRNHIFTIQDEFKDNLKDIFIWKKQAVSSITAKNGGMGKGWEYIFMFGENNLSTFEYNNFPKNGYVPNIQEWFKSEYFDNHHATFPIELPEYFIRFFTKEGDIVLDPFNGTGTTCKAAKINQRNFIGIDVSEEYCAIAERRLEKVNNRKITDFFGVSEEA